MTKQSNKAEVNSFIQGLITEASPLNFPGNATSDEQNFELNRDGTRNRRLGFDLEPDFDLITIDAVMADIQTYKAVPYKWQNVSGDGGTSLLVVQVKGKLYFLDLNQQSLSGSGLVGTVDLGTLAFPTLSAYEFASVDGKLIVAAGHTSVAVVTYSGGSFTVEQKNLLVRDLWGVEEESEPAYEADDTYRGGLPSDHNYNLYNQSWGIPRADSVGVLSDPVSLYQGTLATYPSNSEVVWAGLDFQAVVGGTPYERVFPTLYTETFGNRLKAGKGYFIIDVLNRGVSRAANIVANKAKHSALTMATFTTNADSTPGGAAVICEFAGRVFYAGFDGDVVDGDARSPALSNHILFSQVIKSSADVAKCYQDGDPSSRDGSDVVDTDGGFIRIAGLDTVVKLVNLGTHLVVFATNGIWTVTGGSDYGFTATNYKVDKITSFGALSGSTVVDDGSTALYWSLDGIYSVGKEQMGGLAASNLTEQSIQSLYESIPSTSRSDAVGVFDSTGKKIRWMYNEGTRYTSDHASYELILDTVIKAFSLFRIYNDAGLDAIAVAPFPAVPFTAALVPEVVVVDDDPVVVDGDGVIISVAGRDAGLLSTRYLCFVLEAGVPKLTFGYYNNTRFRDWESVDNVGTDAYGFMTTGAVTAGDSAAVKQVPYLTMHFQRTEDGVDLELNPTHQSGCLVRSQWDFANSANSNKWSSSFQAYRYRRGYLVSDENDPYDTGFELVTTRNKIRGRGRAFAFHMETEPTKDCHIVGWSIALNGNAVV